MMFRNSRLRYGAVSNSLHWLATLVITGLAWLGWYMVDLDYHDRWYDDALDPHRPLLWLFHLEICMCTLYIDQPPRE